MPLSERLHQKGWTPAEIEHAMHHLSLAEERKEPLVKFSDISTYWLLLIAILVSITAVSALFLPFLRIIPKELSFIIMALVGAVFGILYAHVLHDIDQLSHKHHIFILAITVIAALAWSWKMSASLAFGSIFSGLFVLQYLLYWWKK